MTPEQAVIWCLAILMSLLLITRGVGIVLRIVVGRMQRRLRLAEQRLDAAREAAAESLRRLEVTKKLLTFNLVPSSGPLALKICCPKNHPCERHVPQ